MLLPCFTASPFPMPSGSRSRTGGYGIRLGVAKPSAGHCLGLARTVAFLPMVDLLLRFSAVDICPLYFCALTDSLTPSEGFSIGTRLALGMRVAAMFLNGGASC